MCRIHFAEAQKRRLDASIHLTRAKLGARARVLAAYDRLVHAVRSRSSLLSRQGGGHGIDVSRALLVMAHQQLDWLSPVEAWSAPRGAPPWLALGSLAQHLFARYPVPRFMTSVWLEGKPCEVLSQQRWFKHLGAGHNIRTANIPMNITRRMAHRFVLAPHHLSAVAALRWAQVLALGGEPALAQAVLATRLGRAIENEDFWESVIRFFTTNRDVDVCHVGPIIDYAQHQKFATGDHGRPPPEPDFTLAARAPATLLRLVHDWQRGLGRTATPLVTWQPSMIGDFFWLDDAARADKRVKHEAVAWSIKELRSSDELRVEGREMRHCVASYVQACVRRHSSIWSMSVETSTGSRRVLTIEVDPTTRRVRQAKRKLNAGPSSAERHIMALWAEREGLVVPSTLRN